LIFLSRGGKGFRVVLLFLIGFWCCRLCGAQPSAGSVKTTVLRGGVQESGQANSSCPVKNASVPEGFQFKVEREESDNAILVSLRIPASAEVAWQEFVKTCQATAIQVNKNAAALGKWIDNGGRSTVYAERVYAPISPIVTYATKYCTRVKAVATNEGRIKAIAER
jgi:hypothetical protein